MAGFDDFKKVALDHLSEGVVLQDDKGKIVDFNPAALRILGLTHDQLIGRTAMDPKWQAVNEDGSECIGSEHPSAIALRTGVAQTDKIIGVHSNGNFHWMQVNAIPIIDEKSRAINGVVVSFVDITMQILAKKELAYNKYRLDLVLDGLPAMVGHWSADLLNLNANRVYLDYFGKTPGEIKGKHIKEVLGPELFKRNLPYIEGVLRGEFQSFERDLTFRNNEIRNTLANYIPVVENGKVQSFLVIVTDVTELKQAEKRRQELEAQLSEAARLTTLGEMAGGVAHEVNTPLAIIQSVVDLMETKLQTNPNDQEVIRKGIGMIQTAVGRIAKIISGLRAVSKDVRDEPLEKVRVDIALQDTLDLCRERIGNHGIRLKLGEIASVNIMARHAQVSQIFSSLLSNSFDAILNLPEKWIYVSVVSEGSQVKIVFQDSGPGIPPHIASKIMQPFFSTKEIGKGAGLGLSISKGLAESFGGSLIYDETAPHTTFILSFPIA